TARERGTRRARARCRDHRPLPRRTLWPARRAQPRRPARGGRALPPFRAGAARGRAASHERRAATHAVTGGRRVAPRLRLQLAGFPETAVRPALPGQVEVDPARCDVHEAVHVIEGEIVVGLAPELLELAGIVALDPACRRDVHGFELAVDVVLVTQAMRDHVELQRPDGTEDEI